MVLEEGVGEVLWGELREKDGQNSVERRRNVLSNPTENDLFSMGEKQRSINVLWVFVKIKSI